MMRFLIVLLFPAICWAEPATVVRVTDLKKEPATDAATVTTLAENVAVDAQERKGGWVRVRAGAAEGWVRLLALRYGGTAQSGDSGARELFNAARTGSSGTQVTTGVRGLDEQMLANARPNPAELAKMSQFSSTADGAAAFAAQGHLQRRVVPEVK